MKNLFTVIIFTVTLAALSHGQGTVVNSGAQLEVEGKKDKPRIAVLEFTSEPNGAMPVQGTWKLRSAIATALTESGRFDVADIRKTDMTVAGESLTINGRGMTAREQQQLTLTGPTPASAVKVGKLLGVNYVMTGSVVVVNKLRGVLNVQVVNVATGDNVWRGPVTLDIPAGVEINDKVMKPVIQKLTASLKAADL